MGDKNVHCIYYIYKGAIQCTPAILYFNPSILKYATLLTIYKLNA